ncbi:hypothetical protein RA281_29270, partial [Pseudomonas syringae pv. tagetis]
LDGLFQQQRKAQIARHRTGIGPARKGSKVKNETPGYITPQTQAAHHYTVVNDASNLVQPH